MKIRALILFCCLCFSVLLAVGSCATSQNPDKMVFERFCGTWANPAYAQNPGEAHPPVKIVVNPDGTYLRYQKLDQAGPTMFGQYIVEKRWADSEGNSWYHVKLHFPHGQRTWYGLLKIDKFNTVWEIQTSNIDYPTEINPEDWHSDRRIYYRY